jgi:hypothetical protein
MLTLQKVSCQVFQRLTEDKGLPTNFSNVIAQDSFGLIWIATENGLTRFDGMRTKTYQSNENDTLSISTNSILALDIGSSGRLWAGGNDGHINEYDHKKDLFYRTYISEIDSVPDRRIFGFYEDDSILWIAAEVGLLKHNLNTKKTRVINPRIEVKESNNGLLQTVYMFKQDLFDPDLIWIGTRAGLVSLNKRSMSMKLHTKFIPAIPSTFEYLAHFIDQAPDGKIWVGGGWSGIRSYDPINDKWEYFFSGYYPESGVRNDIHYFIQKTDTKFWISSYANGFGEFDSSDGSYTYLPYQADNPYSVQSAPTLDLLKDKNGNIWIAGSHGISYFNPDYPKIKAVPFPDRTVPHGHTDLLASDYEKISDKEILIAAFSGDGLYIADLKTGKCQVMKDYANFDYEKVLSKQTPTNFYDLQVNDLLKVSDEKIWVALDTQFAYFDVPSRQLIFPSETDRYFYKNSNIAFLQLDQKGDMWGINRSRRTLFRASIETGELLDSFNTHAILPQDIGEELVYGVRGFYIDQDNLFWFYTYSLVITWNPHSGKTSVLPKKNNKKNGIEGFDFSDITGAENGAILLSSYTNGVQLIRPFSTTSSDSFELLGLNDGLPIEKAVNVDCYKDFAYIATRMGLVKYHLPSGNIEVFDKQDGIPNQDLFNYYAPSLKCTKDGMVFFGNPNAFCWLNTAELVEATTPPKTMITELIVQGTETRSELNILLNDKINLKPDQNFFTIRFTVPEFQFPTKLRFKYRLIGYDEDWVESGNNPEAIYTKVPGGKYTFEVMGANHQGTWSIYPAKLNLFVETPFFQSRLFYGLLFATIIGIATLLYRFRLRQMKEKEQLKADFFIQLAEVEMSALRAQMNPHFVFNSLNSINKYILTNEPRMASRYLTKFSQLMRLILNNSKSKEIPLEDELNTLSLYVEMEQLRFDQKFQFEKQVNSVDPPSQILIPPMLIQPYIENAIWHGLMPLESPGRLILNITQSGQDLICIIEDNGIGRKKAMELKQKNGVRKKSMGMKITSERLELVEALHHIKTDLEIIDKVSTQGASLGTLVTLKIPVRKKEISSTTSKPNAS